MIQATGTVNWHRLLAQAAGTPPPDGSKATLDQLTKSQIGTVCCRAVGFAVLGLGAWWWSRSSQKEIAEKQGEGGRVLWLQGFSGLLHHAKAGPLCFKHVQASIPLERTLCPSARHCLVHLLLLN